MLTFLCFCNNNAEKGKYSNTDMYDLTSPKVIDLPQILDEISGIAYYAKDTSVFAIVDEEGVLFKINLRSPKQLREWPFDKPSDFEDIVLRDSVFYVLQSKGDIQKLVFTGDSIMTQKAEFPEGSKKLNEFETLYLDAATNRLVIMCKNCEEDGKKTVSTYALDDSSGTFSKFITLNSKDIYEKLGDSKEAIRPSAAAVNPVTKQLYIISSINKCLIIADMTGKVDKVIELNPKIYKQPEGICFTPEGNLIISNEAANSGYGQLLLMKNKKKP